MLFNSFEFVIFFILVTTLYFLLPHKNRWLMLLIASCYFYMAFVPIYIVILFGTIVVDYFAGILIENAEGKRRRLYLAASLVANIGTLAVFKYYNFFISNINEVTSSLSLGTLPLLKMILPIGLSFHTFQAMSYTIEVYRGNHKAERNFGIYSLYVMFYPQLVAGPIERPQNILYQFYEKHTFNWDNFYSGMKRILWGFFKKIVIADRAALIVDSVYNNPHNQNGSAIAIATIFFSFQIYCDFSGYSDIALGTAEVMGFKLMTNFNKPYLASNIAEYWRRWHISLSTWLRDYLYIPLGGNERSVFRNNLNLLIVFMVSGFWHGANWTFIVWGGLHGIFMIIGSLKRKYLGKPDYSGKFGNTRLSVNIVLTFLLGTFTRIYFRSPSIHEANYFVSRLFSGWNITSAPQLKKLITTLGAGDLVYGTFNITLACIMISILMSLERASKKQTPIEYIDSKPYPAKMLIYFGLAMSIFVFGVFENKEFIYFQF